MVFNNGSGTWDNNGGADWHFAVSGTQQPWVMDGQLDAGATQIAQNGTRKLYAGLHGTTLYIAAPVAVAGEGPFHLRRRPAGCATGGAVGEGRASGWLERLSRQ